MPTAIRTATVEDIAVIEIIVQAAYSPYIQRIGRSPGPMLDDYRQHVETGTAHLLESNRQVVGFVVLIGKEDYLLLDNLAVSPAAQGLGYGRQLLAFAEAQSVSAGYRQMRLYTNEAMTENIELYKRRGFVETHRAVENGLRRVYMKKDLMPNKQHP